MSANSRLTVAVHVLTWMALVEPKRHDVVTSEEIAGSLNTNPVVVRRTLGQLRDAGLVSVQRGQGAGWRSTRAPSKVTLLDVYEAVSHEPLFALHAGTPNQACPVGRGIQPALLDAYAQAEEAMKKALAGRTVADVLKETLA